MPAERGARDERLHGALHERLSVAGSGSLKPDLALFQKVLADAGIDPRETVFLDDTPANVLGAERAGMYALLVTGPSYVDWLPKLLQRRWK